MERTYHPLRYRLDGEERYLLWHAGYWDSRGEPDEVWIDEAGAIPAWADQAALLDWAASRGIAVTEEDAILHDLDAVEAWVRQSFKDTIDCVLVLSAWNLFLDVDAAVERRHALRQLGRDNRLYSKIFAGNNLPALTPFARHYTPIWTNREAVRLQQILEGGLRRVRERVVFVPAQ